MDPLASRGRFFHSVEESMDRIGRLVVLAGALLGGTASATVQAPLIQSSTWLNTTGGHAPTLIGRPVLVEFWTFG